MEKSSVKVWTIIKYAVVVVNFIASLTSILGVAYTIYSDNINNSNIYVWMVLGIICILGIIVFLLAIRSEKSDNMQKDVMYATSMHEILHFIRDRRKELDDLYDRNDRMNKNDFIRMITVDNI